MPVSDKKSSLSMHIQLNLRIDSQVDIQLHMLYQIIYQQILYIQIKNAQFYILIIYFDKIIIFSILSFKHIKNFNQFRISMLEQIFYINKMNYSIFYDYLKLVQAVKLAYAKFQSPVVDLCQTIYALQSKTSVSESNIIGNFYETKSAQATYIQRRKLLYLIISTIQLCYKIFIQWQLMNSNSLFRMDDKNSNITVQSLPMKGLFYSRIRHRILRLNDQALIFGGIGSSGEFLKTILRFNLENLKIEPILNIVFPNLEGFSTFTHKGKVYLWGGNLQNKFCNNLWCLQGTNFELCPQKGDIPSPRAFHCYSCIAQKYLLIYGGYGQTQIYNEWYILNLDNFTWNKVQTNQQLPKNIRFQLVWQNGRGILVSSYEITRAGCRPSLTTKNQIYQVKITSFTSYKLRIDQLEQFQGQKFIPRSNFTLVFSQKQLWILGGQIYNQNKMEDPQLCNDVWTLNFQTLTWSKRTFTINTKAGCQIIEFKNKLYLIGGLKSYSQMSTSLQIISNKNCSLLETQVCNFCKNVFSIDAKLFYKKPPTVQLAIKESPQNITQISTNFLSKLARYLQNPIQAIGLLIDNSLNMGASSISVNVRTPELPTNILNNNNSKSFSTDQITKILFSFRLKVEKYYRDHIDKQDIKMRNEYGLNLKLASLRLGSSCLFVTNTTEDQIFVAYYSECQVDCPDSQSSFNCYYYTINQERCSNNIDRQIIRENTRHFISQKQFLNVEIHSTKVFVFSLHDVSKIIATNSKVDIVYPYPQGMPLNSLSQYTSRLYLNPYLGRQIYVQQNKIVFISLMLKLKQDEKNGYIKQIDVGLQAAAFSKLSLYRIQKFAYPLNFVYIYHQNRLINAVQSKDKVICGFIEIPDQIQVDFFKSKLERWQDQRKLIGFIQSKEEPRRRQRKTQICAPQEQNARKIKPPYYNFNQN